MSPVSLPGLANEYRSGYGYPHFSEHEFRDDGGVPSPVHEWRWPAGEGDTVGNRPTSIGGARR